MNERAKKITFFVTLLKSFKHVLIFRGSPSQMFFKIGVLTNFANFTGKYNQFIVPE